MLVMLLYPIYLRPSSVCTTTTCLGPTPTYLVCITSPQPPPRSCGACPTSTWLRPLPSYLAYKAWLCPPPPLSVTTSLPRTSTTCPTPTWHWSAHSYPTCSTRPLQTSSARASPRRPSPLTSCWPCTPPPCPTCSASTTTCGTRWSFLGMTSNKLAKMVNGNRRLGYHLGIWNCRKGLIKDKEVSTKMVDVKNFIYSKKLHLFCLVESDLHGQASRHRRTQPLTTADIHTQLAIPGYKIYLPSTWDKHGQARLIVYAKEELQVKEINTTGDSVSDLPTITFLISLGKERKTAVNFFFTESTLAVFQV